MPEPSANGRRLSPDRVVMVRCGPRLKQGQDATGFINVPQVGEVIPGSIVPVGGKYLPVPLMQHFPDCVRFSVCADIVSLQLRQACRAFKFAVDNPVHGVIATFGRQSYGFVRMLGRDGCIEIGYIDSTPVIGLWPDAESRTEQSPARLSLSWFPVSGKVILRG